MPTIGIGVSQYFLLIGSGGSSVPSGAIYDEDGTMYWIDEDGTIITDEN